MAQNAKVEMHNEIIRDIDRKLTVMVDEMERLKTVRAYHAESLAEMGAYGVGSPTAGANGAKASTNESSLAAKLRGLTKHDAAVEAFGVLNQDATVPQLVDFLRSHGYGTDLSRKIFVNSLRTALDRKPDLFKPVGNGVWRLKQWEAEPSEKA